MGGFVCPLVRWFVTPRYVVSFSLVLVFFFYLFYSSSPFIVVVLLSLGFRLLVSVFLFSSFGCCLLACASFILLSFPMDPFSLCLFIPVALLRFYFVYLTSSVASVFPLLCMSFFLLPFIPLFLFCFVFFNLSVFCLSPLQLYTSSQ